MKAINKIKSLFIFSVSFFIFQSYLWTIIIACNCMCYLIFFIISPIIFCLRLTKCNFIFFVFVLTLFPFIIFFYFDVKCAPSILLLYLYVCLLKRTKIRKINNVHLYTGRRHSASIKHSTLSNYYLFICLLTHFSISYRLCSWYKMK